MAKEEHRVETFSPGECYEARNDDDTCEGVTDLRNLRRKSVKLLIKRRLHAIVNLCGYENLTVFRLIPHGKHTRYAVTFHHRCATHHMVRGEGGFVVKVLLHRSLTAEGFARQGRFVERHGCCLKEFGIGGHFVTRRKDDDVAHHDVLLRHFRRVTATDDLHGFIIVHLIEQFKLLVGLHLEVERKSRCEENGYDDTNGFEEHLHTCTFMTEEFVEGNTYRHDRRNDKNANEGVGKLAEELLPKWFLRGRRQNVCAILRTTLRNFCFREPFVHLFFLHRKVFEVQGRDLPPY